MRNQSRPSHVCPSQYFSPDLMFVSLNGWRFFVAAVIQPVIPQIPARLTYNDRTEQQQTYQIGNGHQSIREISEIPYKTYAPHRSGKCHAHKHRAEQQTSQLVVPGTAEIFQRLLSIIAPPYIMYYIYNNITKYRDVILQVCNIYIYF